MSKKVRVYFVCQYGNPRRMFFNKTEAIVWGKKHSEETCCDDKYYYVEFQIEGWKEGQDGPFYREEIEFRSRIVE